MNKIVKRALDWALEIAADDTHGYSQANRWGPDFDCSSFIINAYEQAGLKVKEAGASFTGNMKAAFKKRGFEVLPDLPVSKLMPGDVLLNESYHTVMYIGDGKVVSARSSDGSPQSGDQSKREICVQDWYEYPHGGWDCVLRYAGESKEQPEEPAEPSAESCEVTLPVLRRGAKRAAVKVMQVLLILKGFSCGPDGADGDFGPNTLAALMSFQSFHDLGTYRGVCEKETWKELFI